MIHTNWVRIIAGIMVAVMVLSAVGAGVAFGQVVAPPSSYHGDAVTEDGTDAPSGTTIVAVVDGTVEDSITVSTVGEYGSPDKKEFLRIPSSSGSVTFHVGSPSGPQADPPGTVTNIENGVERRDLTFPAGAFTSGGGDDGSTDDGATDDGSTDDGATDDGSTDDGATDDGSTDDGSGDDGGSSGGGQGTGGATTDDSEADDQHTDETAPSVEDVRKTLDGESASTETATEVTDADPDRVGVNVQPEGTESVREISFESEDVSGSVEIREYNDLSQDVRETVSDSVTASGSTGDAADGGSASVISAADISPDSETAASSSATVTLSVPADEVTNPDQLTVVKETSDADGSTTWRKLETTLEETGDEEIRVSAQANQFSLFAVAEVEQSGDGSTTPEDTSSESSGDDGSTDDGSTADDGATDDGSTADDGATDDGSTADDGATDDGLPGFNVIIALVALISAALLTLYRHNR